MTEVYYNMHQCNRLRCLQIFSFVLFFCFESPNFQRMKFWETESTCRFSTVIRHDRAPPAAQLNELLYVMVEDAF